ncbi:MAG: cytochrome P450 [Thermomicrobiales bacterium]
MSTRPSADWNPRDAAVLHDQRHAYDEMREHCPVAYSDFLDWSLFRHADVVEVLAAPDLYSSATRHRAVPNGMDPPEHTLYRRALAPYFLPERMSAFEPHCRRIAADLVQALLACEGGELITAFAEPFAIKSLCAFLGWPPETWESLRGWTHGNQEAALSRDREKGAALAREFTGYVTAALQARREAGARAPEDVTTRLLETEVEGELLSQEDIVSVLRNWTAGHGTVAAAVGNLALYLAEHPDAQQQLRREPSLLPAAIDEILRADGPLVANRRTATRDVEIGSRAIAAGAKISLNWIAANRDGRAFADPDAVRFDRDPTGNLLFGAGIHDCLGAPLARLEMRVALEELLARTTAIELDSTRQVSRAVYPSNGVAQLPVRLC